MSTPKYTDDDLKRVAGIVDEMFNDKLDTVLEVVVDIQTKVALLPTRDEFNVIKSDMKVVKAAVTDTNIDLQRVERKVGLKPSWRKRFH